MNEKLENVIIKPKVLIACSGDWDSLVEIPYVLNKGGCEVNVFCSKSSWLLKNSFFHNWIDSNNSKDYCQSLINLIKTTDYDWVILGDEHLLKLLNENIQSEILFKKILPLSKIENRKLLGSKNGLESLCEKYNFLSPKTLLFEKASDLFISNLEIQFPVLIKIDHSWGGAGIVLCNDINSLLLETRKIKDDCSFQIQEFIKGEDIGVECLFKNGQLLTYQSAKVIEYKVDQFQATMKRKYFYSEAVEELIKHIGDNLGINGFASIQFVYDSSKDKYYLIEVDLRPQAWIRSGIYTGNNFSIGVKRFTGQLPITQECYKPSKIEKDGTVVLLFHRVVISFFITKNFKGIFNLIFNIKNWKFIPLYDRKFMNVIMKDVKSITVNRILRFVK